MYVIINTNGTYAGGVYSVLYGRGLAGEFSATRDTRVTLSDPAIPESRKLKKTQPETGQSLVPGR